MENSEVANFTTLHVSNLIQGTKEEDLLDFFKDYNVKKVKMIK